MALLLAPTVGLAHTGLQSMQYPAGSAHTVRLALTPPLLGLPYQPLAFPVLLAHSLGLWEPTQLLRVVFARLEPMVFQLVLPPARSAHPVRLALTPPYLRLPYQPALPVLLAHTLGLWEPTQSLCVSYARLEPMVFQLVLPPARSAHPVRRAPTPPLLGLPYPPPALPVSRVHTLECKEPRRPIRVSYALLEHFKQALV